MNRRVLTSFLKRLDQVPFLLFLNVGLLFVGIIIWILISRELSALTLIPLVLPVFILSPLYLFSFSSSRLISTGLSQLCTGFSLAALIAAPIVLAIQVLVGYGIYELISLAYNPNRSSTHVPPHAPEKVTMLGLPQSHSIAVTFLWTLLTIVVQNGIFAILFKFNLNPQHSFYDGRKYAHLPVQPALRMPPEPTPRNLNPFVSSTPQLLNSTIQQPKNSDFFMRPPPTPQQHHRNTLFSPPTNYSNPFTQGQSGQTEAASPLLLPQSSLYHQSSISQSNLLDSTDRSIITPLSPTPSRLTIQFDRGDETPSVLLHDPREPNVPPTRISMDKGAQSKLKMLAEEDDEKTPHGSRRKLLNPSVLPSNKSPRRQINDNVSPFPFNRHFPPEPYPETTTTTNGSPNIQTKSSNPTTTTTTTTTVTSTVSTPDVRLDNIPSTHQKPTPDFVMIDTMATPAPELFQVYQMEHPSYKARLLGLILGFSTGIFIIQMILGAVYIYRDPQNQQGSNLAISQGKPWALLTMLLILFVPHALISYHQSLIVFVGHWFRYFPYNRDTLHRIPPNRADQVQFGQRSFGYICGSYALNLMYPLLNNFVFTFVNYLLLFCLISRKAYVSVPIFVLFNIGFTLFQLLLVFKLELAGLSINCHVTGSLIFPQDLEEHLLLVQIPPRTEYDDEELRQPLTAYIVDENSEEYPSKIDNNDDFTSISLEKNNNLNFDQVNNDTNFAYRNDGFDNVHHGKQTIPGQ
jgi:hypothetical protein